MTEQGPHNFTPLSAIDKGLRGATIAAYGGMPLGPRDGIIEPSAWEGQSIPGRQWIVDDLIPCGEVTQITGNGGEGKSLLTMQLLIAAATGTRWLGKNVKNVRVAGIYCEDDTDELMRRSSGILFPQRLRFADLDGMSLVCRKGMDSVMFAGQFNDMEGRTTQFYERVRAFVMDLGAQIVVLDSLYNFFGGNENSRPQANQFINALAQIAQDINGAVIVVAHPSVGGMQSGAGTSGSTAWHNAVRSRLYLHRRKVPAWELEKNPEARGDLILQPMKGNYGPPQDAIKLLWEQGRFVPVIDPTLQTPPLRTVRTPYRDDEDMT